MRTMRAGTIRLNSGIELSYAECGEPNGLPVLFLHGWPDSWRSCEPLLALLPPSIRAVAITHRGHGDSSKPIGRYGMDELAQDAVDAMDRLDINRAVVFGHSMGSLVASRIAIDRPERVLGLVLVGAVLAGRRNEVLETLLRDDVATMTDPIDPAFVRAFQESAMALPAPQAFLELVINESLKVPAHVWRSALVSLLAADFGGAFGRIKAPTRIIWGDQDSIVLRPDQDALIAAIPHAKFVLYEGLGHSPHWEEPSRVAADVSEFVNELTALADDSF